MPQRTTIVRNTAKIGKSRLHDVLMIGWARMIARHGKSEFADELGVTTAAIDKQLQGTMPGFDLIVDACGMGEGDVLSEVCDALGVRIVPKEAACDTDDFNLLLARALVTINEAMHPDSPGGRTVTHTEYLDGEEVMRALHKASGDWLQACADIRKPRSVA